MAFRQTFPNHVLTLPRILIQTGKREQIGAKKIQTICKICDSFSSLIINLKILFQSRLTKSNFYMDTTTQLSVLNTL